MWCQLHRDALVMLFRRLTTAIQYTTMESLCTGLGRGKPGCIRTHHHLCTFESREATITPEGEPMLGEVQNAGLSSLIKSGTHGAYGFINCPSPRFDCSRSLLFDLEISNIAIRNGARIRIFIRFGYYSGTKCYERRQRRVLKTKSTFTMVQRIAVTNAAAIIVAIFFASSSAIPAPDVSDAIFSDPFRRGLAFLQPRQASPASCNSNRMPPTRITSRTP